MKRKITDYLNNWKNNDKRVPLVIKGLRQVGKTHIVKEFARNNYENAFILDFRKQISLHSIFEGDFNIDNISLMISSLPSDNQVIKGSKMVPYKTIIIFDELQDCPNARSSLKYFKEDGRYDVICTGSLLGIDGYRIGKKVSRGIAVGSEEQIEMFSMDFEEFMWAKGIDDNLIDLIKQKANEQKEIPQYFHELLLGLVRQYICIGGLPEVVKTFVTSNNYGEARKVQKRLLKDYKTDFGTHLNDDNEIVTDELEKTRIMEVFNSIPKQLSKENKKFQYVVIDKKAKARTHKDAINWLKNYGLIDICYNLSTIEEPYDFMAIKDQFKVYVSDIGLLVAMLEDDVPFKILSNDLGIGKGMIYENLVADSLHKLNKPMYYFSKDSGLEIDFVSTLFNKPYLVEVKAKSGKAKAARSVIDNPNYKVNNLLKLTSQNIGITEDTITAPYYLSFYLLNK